MKYKALLLDIDGTLTLPIITGRMNPMPSQKVFDAIKKAEKYVAIVLATSRSATFTRPISNHLQLSGPIITQGGALIVEGLSGKVLWEKHISNDNFYTVARFLTKHKFSFVIDEKEKTGIPYVLSYKPHNVLTMFVSELTKQQADFVEQNLFRIPGITLHKVGSWSPHLWGFNITNSEVSKQHAVVELLRLLNIYPEEIIAVGDSYSDFPLLMASGLKVAMGNAVPELKEIADYIAPSVEEDGVADVIEKFVLNPS